MPKIKITAEWLKENKEKILPLLPETWTHIQNINGLALGFQFKKIGLDWRSENDFGAIMVMLEKNDILQRDGFLIRRSNIK